LIQCFSYTGPLRGGRDDDLAHGEDEFDALPYDIIEHLSVFIYRDACVVFTIIFTVYLQRFLFIFIA